MGLKTVRGGLYALYILPSAIWFSTIEMIEEEHVVGVKINERERGRGRGE